MGGPPLFYVVSLSLLQKQLIQASYASNLCRLKHLTQLQVREEHQWQQFP